MAATDRAGNGIVVGDVVQIDPESDPHYGGCFMVILELKLRAAIGYIQAPDIKGHIYYHCPFATMHWIGRAEWPEWVTDRDTAQTKVT